MLVLTAGTLLSAGTGLPLHAAGLRVPETYPTIQSALDAAHAGDSVLVAPGDYLETVLLQADSVWIVGEQGAAATRLRGFSETAITIADSTVGAGIQGLEVRPPPGIVTNIYARPGSRVRLVGLEIEGGVIGLRCQGAHLDVSGCHIRDCTIAVSADAGAAPRFESCTLTDNRVGVSASRDGIPLLRYNRMERNAFANLQVAAYSAPAIIDAERNWWGSADEAGVLATIKNDAAEMGVVVRYAPWCETPDCEALPTEPATWGWVKRVPSAARRR